MSNYRFKNVEKETRRANGGKAGDLLRFFAGCDFLFQEPVAIWCFSLVATDYYRIGAWNRTNKKKLM